MRTLLLVFAMLALSGCATAVREPAVLKLGIDTRPEATRLTWPPQDSSEIPRYIYLGELTGENNFVRPGEDGPTAKSLLARFFDFIIGESPPLVMDRPQAGVVDEFGRVLVTDLGRSGVFVFDDKAGRLSFWEKASGLTEFVSPVGIAAGPEGQTFVADAELRYVARLDREGNPLDPIGKGLLERPTGLAYEPKSKRLYVADTQAHEIKVFDLAGNVLSVIGEHGEGPGQFNYPTHIAVRHEKLYVSDTLNARVQIISTPTGRYLGTLGKRGLFVGDLVRPKGVATDGEHNVYVVESYHDYLLVYNRRGEFLIPIGGIGTGPGNFHLPAGVWTDVQNRVFVADMLNGRVAVMQFLGGDDEYEDR